MRTRLRRLIRSALGRSDLDVVIAPEVHHDSFARLATELAAEPDVRTAIDVGASSGGGSSAALFEGLRAKHDALLVCLELSEARFEQLVERYAPYPWVHCLNDSSVPLSSFPGDDDVRRFVESRGGPDLYHQSIDEVLRWLRQDREYMTSHHATGQGITSALALTGADVFDLVLIDGSEFTGEAELDRLYGARFVLLDDVRTFKNFVNRQRLLDDPAYELVAEDVDHRNGYSAFRRI